MKNIVKNILKLLFAGAIIFWLFKKGQIDFNLVQRSLEFKLEWAFALFLLFFGIVLTGLRWRIILKSKSSQKLPRRKIVALNWIGCFFSSVLPGAVTGDLIKLVYAKDLDPNFNRTFLLMSAFIDRIIGLIGLIILMGIFTILNYQQLASQSPELQKLVHLNFILFSGAIAFVLTIFVPIFIQAKVLHFTESIPFAGKFIHKILHDFWIIGRKRKNFLICVALSIYVQTQSAFVFWFLSRPFFSSPLPFSEALTFIPLGFVAVAIPITPAGLGIGHAIFNTLFKLHGVDHGASLFNLYFLASIVVNILGVIPYLMSGKKHHLNEVESFQ